MSEANKASAAARDLISKVYHQGSDTLSFTHPIFRNLKQIPSSILELEDLKYLHLGGTQVEDISFIVGLQKLVWLQLTNTQVLDLTPLAAHTSFSKNLDAITIYFTGCRAARDDKNLSRIALISDDGKRNRALFAYLNKTNNSGASIPPETAQDPIHPVELNQGALEVAASCPTAEEQEDALKRAMHRSLPDLLERLAREAGNQFPRLAESARRLTTLLDAPFENLDMALLHLGFNELRAAERAGEEDGMAFAPPLQTVLSNACDAGGALTVDHPMVTLLMERARKARDHPDPQEDREIQNAMSRQVAEAQEAMGDRLRALEARVADSDDPQDQEAQKAVNRNVLWRIAIAAGGFSGVTVCGKVVGDVLGQPIVDFVMTNLPVLNNAALTYGPVFADWFLSSLAKCQEFAGAIASLSADAQLHDAKKRLERSDT